MLRVPRSRANGKEFSLKEDVSISLPQESMQLSREQEDQILCSHGVMHQMLAKCAAERNDHILPQLGLEGMQTPQASQPSSFYASSSQQAQDLPSERPVFLTLRLPVQALSYCVLGQKRIHQRCLLSSHSSRNSGVSVWRVGSPLLCSVWESDPLTSPAILPQRCRKQSPFGFGSPEAGSELRKGKFFPFLMMWEPRTRVRIKERQSLFGIGNPEAGSGSRTQANSLWKHAPRKRVKG